MPAYLYRSVGRSATPAGPDAESVLDALADRMLEQPDVGAALSALERTGFPQRSGPRHPGTGDLARAVRQAQRALKRRYSFESVTQAFAHEVRAAVREELRATAQHFAERSEARAAAAAEWEAAAGDLARQAAGSPPAGARPLRQHEAEQAFEALYVQVQGALAEARADQQEERERLGRLEDLPREPVESARALADYPFLAEEAAERIDELNAARPHVAELAASEWRHPFTGDEPVDADGAEAVAERMRGLDRLEGQLRSGRLREVDPAELGSHLGSAAVRAVEGLQRLEQLLRDAGYLVLEGAGVGLSPRAMRRLGERALREMFTALKRTTPGEHVGDQPGPGARGGPTVRPFDAGDPFDLHLNESLFRAARRRPCVPLALHPSDFMVYGSEATVHSATVLMLDLSNTMLRRGRILAAKKVALALDTLLRRRFPKDSLELVGFSTLARQLTLAELPNVAPTPGQPFTNMQDGLRLATRLLRRHRGANRQIILITDGEPTAVLDEAGRVRSCYPPDEDVFERTLQAARACTAHGIVINVIMLDRQPELVEFVRRMAHLNRGRALFCTPETLGQYVIYDYARGKRLAVAS